MEHSFCKFMIKVDLDDLIIPIINSYSDSRMDQKHRFVAFCTSDFGLCLRICIWAWHGPYQLTLVVNKIFLKF